MKKIYIIAASVFLLGQAQAMLDPTKAGINNKPTVNSSLQAKAANCAASVGLRYLEQNNVRALIETGGSMWQDRARGRAGYEVPKGSDEYVIYAGALWMGGTDVNNQLKFAGLRFRQGNDFWTGPLTVIPGTGNINIGRKDFGPAEIEPDVCAQYDKFYYITKQEVTIFNAWYSTCQMGGECDEFVGYSIPSSILNWPAHGDVSRFQDFYLAPFYDRDGDGVYNPTNGDYPWYDLNDEVDCRSSRQVTLYGDYTMWWVFNDKGNIHTESNGDPIGMEIRAQAFAFATNDEINNMTFYNYEMINRSTQRLQNTYFAVFVDADLGCSNDDYAGCDVSRGVGYTYNGDNFDETSAGCIKALGSNPPAIGVDFFEGPYQDNDGLDNPLTTDVALAIAQKGIPYKGLGIGYGDGIIDNERLGMKRFTFFNRADLAIAAMQDPSVAVQYYNYMKGIWIDGSNFVWGGNGHQSTGGTIPTDYCFPADSDPLFWATKGIPATPANWSEITQNNQPADRRFVQAAGPFTLEPGALNNITVGVVYARDFTGDNWTSVEKMLKADDKAQALFDNCFKLFEGPWAPELTIQELDKELILYISNPKGSNNYRDSTEDYKQKDPIIEALDPTYDPYYRFQGYQIYQVKSADIGPDQVNDISKARLVAQCDIKDGNGKLINWIFDESVNAAVPTLMVDGADAGIKHSFKVTEDKFASGNTRLINHKKYYYIAIAYGFNEYLKFDPFTAPEGQQFPYVSGGKSGTGGNIESVTGIPHIVTPEIGGTVQMSTYGYGPKITRVEGRGNGGNFLDLTPESELDIVRNIAPQRVTYDNAKGPINVKVIDPLNVVNGTYELWFNKDNSVINNNTGSAISSGLAQARWTLVRSSGGQTDTIKSDRTIAVGNEQLIPEWGISVEIEQYKHQVVAQAGLTVRRNTEYINSEYVFSGSNQWLTGVSDQDGGTGRNWIRSGTASEDPTTGLTACEDPAFFNDNSGWDDQQIFEGVLGGTWAPFILTATGDCYNTPLAANASGQKNFMGLWEAHSVDIVITRDRSKWTRCVVFETQDNPTLAYTEAGVTPGTGTVKMNVKLMPSKDKNGNSATPGSGVSTNENDPNYISERGMSWFPGYAIDLETGERLNMAFGEDSWLGNDNGKDMIFNPTKRIEDINGSETFGGKHYVYVYRNTNPEIISPSSMPRMPVYDNGQFLADRLIFSTTSVNRDAVWRSCMWVGIPTLSETAKGQTTSDPYSYIESDVKMKIRVKHEYGRHNTLFRNSSWNSDLGSSRNNWYNLYEFTMADIATVTNDNVAADSTLALINIVPNPYYAYSNYEFNRLDNIVKIVNLPDQCTVTIYNTQGTLIRTFKKDSPITSIDWDLKNFAGIPIASGMYIVHVDVPGVGERILKWMGVIRPPDLQNF
jgi:hypothetical protein